MAFGTIVGSMIAAYASDQSSGEVSDAADASAAEQRRQFNQLRQDTEPYRETGANALYGMTNMLGLGGREYYETQADLRDRRQTLADTDRYKREFVGVGDFEEVPDAQARERGLHWRNKKTGEYLTEEEHQARIAQGNQERVENPEYIQLEEEIGQLEQELEGLDPQAQGAESQFDISQTPGYQFRMGEGMNALDQSLAATGNRFSGRAAKAAQRYGQGLASQEFSNRFNRLASLSGRGQAAVETSGQAGMQAAGQIGNAMMAGGRARAGGIAGMNQAVQGGIGNYLSHQQNQELLNALGNNQGGAGYRGGGNYGGPAQASYGGYGQYAGQ